MRTAKTLIGWADAQADLSLRWAYSHFVGFVVRRLMCLYFSLFVVFRQLSPSQGFWGTGEQGQFFQGNKDLKMRGTGEHRQFWGTENIDHHDFVLGEQGN